MGFGRFPAMVCPWAENGTLRSYLKDRHAHLPEFEILGLVSILGTYFKNGSDVPAARRRCFWPTIL